MSTSATSTAPEPKKYEVVWCCPCTLSLVRNSPKRAVFTSIRHAAAFVKCSTLMTNTFFVITTALAADAITHEQNVTKMLSTSGRGTSVQWEVLGMLRADASKLFKLCDGERLVFADKAAADKTANFIRQFPHSIRDDMLLMVVKYQGDRVFQEGLATQLNTQV